MMPNGLIEWFWFSFFVLGALGGWVALATRLVRRDREVYREAPNADGLSLSLNGIPLRNVQLEASGAIIVTARFGDMDDVSDAQLDAGLYVTRHRFLPAVEETPKAKEPKKVKASASIFNLAGVPDKGSPEKTDV
jgi:hypothetical protein